MSYISSIERGDIPPIIKTLIIMKTLKEFKAGKSYIMKFIGDSEMKIKWNCTKRTPKTITFKCADRDEVITRKVREYGDREYILEGNYSMAPSIYADSEF